MPTSSTETQERSVIMNATIPTLTHATIHDYYGHNPFTGYVQYIKQPDKYIHRLVFFGPGRIPQIYCCRISNLVDSKIPIYPQGSLVKVKDDEYIYIITGKETVNNNEVTYNIKTYHHLTYVSLIANHSELTLLELGKS